jgi:hypothetical protein
MSCKSCWILRRKVNGVAELEAIEVLLTVREIFISFHCPAGNVKILGCPPDSP